MKKSSSLLIFFALLGPLFFLSCNSNEESKPTDSTTSDTSTAKTTTETPPPSTISTTPQGMMSVRHHVKDFAKWLASYETHDSMRLANGIHSYVIGRGDMDSNMVLVAVKVEDMAKAKAFAKNPSLKQAMQKGGVTSAPVMNFTTMVYQDSALIDSILRSITNITVTD